MSATGSVFEILSNQSKRDESISISETIFKDTLFLQILMRRRHAEIQRPGWHLRLFQWVCLGNSDSHTTNIIQVRCKVEMEGYQWLCASHPTMLIHVGQKRDNANCHHCKKQDRSKGCLFIQNTCTLIPELLHSTECNADDILDSDVLQLHHLVDYPPLMEKPAFHPKCSNFETKHGQCFHRPCSCFR